ncbi:MAG: glycosyltransferase [Clostridia bacterium]|nr:glycosyltransferase [Clostridia bacterium]
MNDLCMILTATDDLEGFVISMESLCEQSDEDFDVLMVLGGENETLMAKAQEYCDEYVGMRVYGIPETSVPQMRNFGVKQATNPLVGFIDGGDYLAPDSVAAFKEIYKEQKADIISPRLYNAGENEPFYEQWSDLLATVSHADKLDTALLHTLDAEGRVYKKKFFDLYSLQFPEQPILYNASLLAACVFQCDASLSGAAKAVYSRRHGYFSDGVVPEAQPGEATLKIAAGFFDGLTDTVRTLLTEETGGFDGDETGFQEILSVYFEALTERFYRRFWYLNDDDIAMLRDRFEAIGALQTAQRREKTAKENADLRMPSMYMSLQDAADLPMVSLIIESVDGNGISDFLLSLYNGRFPFFEAFLRESLKEYVPERFRDAGNLHYLPDGNFFQNARMNAKGVEINVKDLAPLDPKVLCELSVVKAPKTFYQYLFASKRKKYSAKTFLKQKGVSMK